MPEKLIFVYNAKTGLLNKLTDIAHRALSPSTYNCNLCKVTYGAKGMHSRWREYIEALPVPVEFLYQDQLAGVYGIDDMVLPAIMCVDSEGLRTLVDSEAIRGVTGLAELERLVDTALGLVRDGERA